MVNRCANPTCTKEFRLLSAGDLYALEGRACDTEFFWICPECARAFVPVVDRLGKVTVMVRGERVCAGPPDPEHDLRLVAHLNTVGTSWRRPSWPPAPAISLAQRMVPGRKAETLAA